VLEVIRYRCEEIMELTGLKGKSALITGASRGIGKSIAKVLTESGVRIICCARNEQLLLETCSEIEKNGGVAVPVRADVSSDSERKQLIKSAISSFEGIDFLINNAGIHTEKPALELKDEEFLQVMETNFFSMFSFSRELARSMIERGGGKIINIGSFWGQLGVIRNLAYCVSKAGIEAMTRCLAVEWARYNIQVNTIAPGHITTDVSKGAMANEKLRDIILSHIPARRLGDPVEVANLVAYLCSQEANYITGHIYYIDGGQFIAW
jgi:NAD(P)-dependent dehydrogenase (short-subunit alcohol dehydrogenase family)